MHIVNKRSSAHFGDKERFITARRMRKVVCVFLQYQRDNGPCSDLVEQSIFSQNASVCTCAREKYGSL